MCVCVCVLLCVCGVCVYVCVCVCVCMCTCVCASTCMLFIYNINLLMFLPIQADTNAPQYLQYGAPLGSTPFREEVAKFLTQEYDSPVDA